MKKLAIVLLVMIIPSISNAQLATKDEIVNYVYFKAEDAISQGRVINNDRDLIYFIVELLQDVLPENTKTQIRVFVANRIQAQKDAAIEAHKSQLKLLGEIDPYLD